MILLFWIKEIKMSKVNIYGKAGNNFYKVTEHSLDGVWDYKLKEYDEIDFVEQGGSHYTLGENEIFFIKTENENIGEYLNKMKSTSDCNSITRDALKKIETLYVFEKINHHFHLYIQRIMPSARIEKPILSFNELAYIETNKITIPICNHTHLYWNQGEQKICFVKFSDLELVFPSFSKYYREATKEDIQIFKDNNKYPFLKVQNLNFESLSKRKLKTIAMIVDELEKVKERFEEYKNYALKYKQDFLKNNEFEINNEKDIEHLADIVFRKIYTTEAGEEEIRVANSYKTISNK